MTRHTILAGHPVPYSLTVQWRGHTVRRLTPAARRAVVAYLALHLPGATIERHEGGYVWYRLD